MVSSSRQAIVYLLLVLSTVVSAQSQSAADKSATSSISGKVTVGGKGVSGVVVGLLLVESPHRSHSTHFKAVTDEEGNYRITKVRPATYDVVAAAPAYVATDGRKSVIVGPNEAIENIDITLLRGGVITGKVTDADGNPVIAEPVYLLAATPRRLTGPATQLSIRTDDRGVYRAYGIPAGSYKVFAGRDETHFGSISSKGGHPRTYHPGAADAAQATAVEVSEGTEAINIDITLVRPALRYNVSGRIIDADTSNPMPGLRVGVQVFFQSGRSSITAATTNKQGEFHVANLAPGKYAVYVEQRPGSELHTEPLRFEVINQDIDGLLLKTSIGASASGVVIVEGSDDPKVRANLARGRIVGVVANDNLGPSAPSVNIQPDGSFHITGMPAGRFMPQVNIPDKFKVMRLERDGVVYPRGVDIKPGEHITGLRVVLNHANGVIRGSIVLPEGLVLPPTTRFLIGVRRTEDAPFVGYGSPVEADARRQFVVDGLIAGTYEVNLGIMVDVPLAQRPRIPRTSETVVITSGSVAEVTLTVQMPKPGP